MVVFSNRHLGPSVELLVSDEVATTLMRETAAAARPFATARWEVELVSWLEARAQLGASSLDVSEIAWTPEHFDVQQSFLVRAIRGAAQHSEHAFAFDRWRLLVELHPRQAVQVGRRWQWPHNFHAMRDTARDVADGGERSEVTGYVGTADLSLGR